MTGDSNNRGNDESGGVIETLKRAKGSYDLVIWVITIANGIISLIQSKGGIFGFLREVVIYGIALYIALVVLVPILALLFDKLEKSFNRVTNDTTVKLIIAFAVIGGGIFIKTNVFIDYSAEEMDAFGKILSVIFGLAILAIPLFLLWYHQGSKPRVESMTRK